MKEDIAIGVDIGGSHISCAAFNMKERKYLSDTFFESDLDNHGEAAQIVDVWGKTLKKVIEVAGIENVSGIGFAMPGPFDYVKGVPLFTGENEKYENIYGLNVPQALREYLDLGDNFPIRFINDATAFAIGEDWVGKAEGARRSLSITLGTGFGSAFMRDGIPVAQGDEVPEQGCLWHVPFEDGIGDDYFSTRGIVKRYNKKTGKEVRSAKEVAEAALTDEAAKSIFEDFGEKLVVFLKPWFVKFDVEVLVIGGNISRAFDLFSPSLKASLLKDGLKVRVEISDLKDTASIIGSSRLCKPDFWDIVFPLLKNM